MGFVILMLFKLSNLNSNFSQAKSTTPNTLVILPTRRYMSVFSDTPVTHQFKLHSDVTKSIPANLYWAIDVDLEYGRTFLAQNAPCIVDTGA